MFERDRITRLLGDDKLAGAVTSYRAAASGGGTTDVDEALLCESERGKTPACAIAICRPKIYSKKSKIMFGGKQ